MSTMTYRRRRGFQPWQRLFSLIAVVALLPVLSASAGAPPTPAPPTPSAVSQATIVSVETGTGFGCKLMSDGAIVCWGDNNYGKATPPAGIFSQLSTGVNHACALDQRAQAVCWGWNSEGQATPPASPLRFRQISAGWNQTCAIGAHDGLITCWGGGAPLPDQYRYIPFEQVSVDEQNACAVVRGSGEVICWGDNGLGETNVPDYAQSGISTVSAERDHTCALTTGGDIICWGDNNWGQSPIVAYGPFLQVDTGRGRTCAIRATGTIVCWGYVHNEDAPPNGSFAQISLGAVDSCGLRSDGTCTCWGLGFMGVSGLDMRPVVLPRAISGADYSQSIVPSDFFAPYSVAITQGSLPAGMSLTVTGTLSGRPTGNGVYAFTVMASSYSQNFAGRSYLLIVTDPLRDFLLPDDSGQTLGFGSITAIDGDQAVVAAPGTSDIYVFERVSSMPIAWHQTAKLASIAKIVEQPYLPYPAPVKALALSGDTIVAVVVNRAGPGWEFQGFIYRRDLTAPTGWRFQQDFHYGSFFNVPAAMIALDGDTLVVGNPGVFEDPLDDDALADVRILRRGADPHEPERWVEEKIINLEYRDLALHDGRLAVATANATTLFLRDTGTNVQWDQEQMLAASGPLAISEVLWTPTILIGDPTNDRVLVFNQNIIASWEVTALITRPNGISASLDFGSDVILNGNVAVIAATASDSSPGWSAVYSHAPSNANDWLLMLQLYKTTDALELSGQTLLARFDTSLDPNADQQREIVVAHWLQLADELVVAGGHNQTVVAGALLNPPPQVLVLDINGNPVPSFSNVVFDGGTGGSFVDPYYMNTANVPTDSSGIAAMPAYRAGQALGTHTITVRLATNIALDQETFNFTVVPPPHHITVTAGDNQHVLVGSTAPITMVVSLTDSTGNPIEGLEVTFSAPATGPSGVFELISPSAALGPTAIVQSDANGLAKAPPFRANSIPGSYVITVTVEGAPTPISIHMTNDARLCLPLIVAP